TRQHLRCGAFGQADTIGPRGSGQTGEGTYEIARRVRSPTKLLGWRSGGEFLRKECNVELKPRQARNWLKRLGFVLKRPVYRYIQASNKGVARFRRGLKKNSTES